MDDQELGLLLDGPLEELERRRDAARDLRHLVGALHLHPHRPVVGMGVEIEQLGGVLQDRVAAGHAAIL